MRIRTFAYTDLKTGWALEESEFDALTLLVGISGVGKTRIIEALRTVTAVALNKPDSLPLAEWSLRFEHKGVEYDWDAHIEQEPKGQFTRCVFKEERLLRDGATWIQRDAGSLVFEGREQAKLAPTASALELFSGEDSVVAALEGFGQVFFSLFTGDRPNLAHSPFDVPEGLNSPREYLKVFRDSKEKNPRFVRNVSRNRQVRERPVFIVHLYFMQEVYPEQFAQLIEEFRVIFPSVESVRVVQTQSRPREVYAIELKESSGAWIPQSHISSGMLRTLVYLYEFETAPAGSVILLDEFEGNMGVNCLPVITERLLARTDCQFIVTSHHPYVINNIPLDAWRLVERTGASVRLVRASEIPALQKASLHEAFLRLINLDQYHEAIR